MNVENIFMLPALFLVIRMKYGKEATAKIMGHALYLMLLYSILRVFLVLVFPRLAEISSMETFLTFGITTAIAATINWMWPETTNK